MTRPIQDDQAIVFLDRDGTINENYEDGPVYRAERFKLLDGAARGIRLLNDLGVKVIVVTNQGGINHTGRDFDWAEYRRIERFMHEGLQRDAGARLDDVFVCHHADYENCPCRKPGTGLFRQAKGKYDFDPRQSYMVGDSEEDIIAGRAARLRTILVESGWQQGVRERAAAKGIIPDKVTADLLQASIHICSELSCDDRK